MDLFQTLFALYGRDVIEITLFVGMEVAGYKALLRLLERPVEGRTLISATARARV